MRISGLHDAVSVQEFGIDNVTAADGLAVGRPSGFVGRAMQRLIDGYYTVADEELFRLLALAHREEGVKLEPSALAGMPGMVRVLRDRAYLERIGVTPARRAAALDFKAETSFDEIIRIHIEDELGGKIV